MNIVIVINVNIDIMNIIVIVMQIKIIVVVKIIIIVAILNIISKEGSGRHRSGSSSLLGLWSVGPSQPLWADFIQAITSLERSIETITSF